MTIHIGWAMTENEKEKSRENVEIYKSTDFSDIVKFEKTPAYGRGNFKGQLKEDSKLTPDEILLYADDGNLCFGGNCIVHSYPNNTFEGYYNTD